MWVSRKIKIKLYYYHFLYFISPIEILIRVITITQADSREAKDDLKSAKQLIKKREQLQTSGQDTDTTRFVVNDKNIEPN